MTHRGQDAQFKSATGGATLALVGERRSWKITATAEFVSDTVQGDDWETGKAGLKKFNLSLDGYLDTQDAAQAELTEGELIDFECFPEGANGSTESGQAIITSREIGTDTDGIVSVAIAAQGVGALTRTPAA